MGKVKISNYNMALVVQFGGKISEKKEEKFMAE